MRWAVILAGGSGTRFWPLSTPRRPKQLLPLTGPTSTAEQAVARLEGLVAPEQILVVAGEQLASALEPVLRIPRANFLLEPRAASTGPALVWATWEAWRRDPEAEVLSLHADWVIREADLFRQTADFALQVARVHGKLVVVGVVPTRPDPGYGYILPGASLQGEARAVARFTEKPTASNAQAMIAAGALWNSGLFAWPASLLLDEVACHTPEIAVALPRLRAGKVTEFFQMVTPISIDVGVLERSPTVAVVPGRFNWDDVGTWDALPRVRPTDGEGNVTVGPVYLHEARECVVWSDQEPVVLEGVEGLVVVRANGRILVMNRTKASVLKEVLEALPADVRELPEEP